MLRTSLVGGSLGSLDSAYDAFGIHYIFPDLQLFLVFIKDALGQGQSYFSYHEVGFKVNFTDFLPLLLPRAGFSHGRSRQLNFPRPRYMNYEELMQHFMYDFYADAVSTNY